MEKCHANGQGTDQILGKRLSLIMPKFSLLNVVTSLQKWKWAYIEHKEWRPGVGVVGPLRLPYLTSLANELSGNG